MMRSLRGSGRVLAFFVFLAPLAWAAPAGASHATFFIDRSPAGPVAAGTVLAVTALVENESATEELLDGTFFANLQDSPYLGLEPGSVTARYRFHNVSSGTVVLGNEPSDRDVAVDLDPVPPGWTAMIGFRVGVADQLPPGVEEDAFSTFFEAPHPGMVAPVRWEVQVPILAEPALVLEKDDAGAVFSPGSSVRYLLTARNVGTQATTGVVLTDTVPAGTRFVAAGSHPAWACVPDEGPGSLCSVAFGLLGAGQRRDFAFSLRADGGPAPAGLESVRNEARVVDDGSQTGGVVQEAEAFEETPLVAAPDLFVAKDDGGAVARPGDVVVYEVRYGNDGDQDASGVVLSETVPEHGVFEAAGSTPGWSCAPGAGPGTVCSLGVGTLSVGEAGLATFAVRVDARVPAGAERLTNVVTIGDDGASGADLDPGNDRATEQTPLEAAPELGLVKGDGGVIVRPGEVVAYSLSYENLGPQGATGVVLEETVPAEAVFEAGASSPGWSCSPASGVAGAVCSLAVGGLASGESGAATFAVRVDPVVSVGVDELVNVARVRDDGANGDDPVPGNDRAVERTPVAAAPDLSVVKTARAASVRPGEVLVYDLGVENVGSQGATGVFLSERVPDFSTFVPGSSTPGWLCASGGGAGDGCTLMVGNVAAGGSESAVFAVRVAAEVPAGVVQVENSVTVGDDGANGDDPDSGNDESTEVTPVDAAPDLVVVKDDGGVTVRPGEVVSYQVSYENRGDQGATGVVLEELVPAGALFEAGASDSRWACSAGALLAGVGEKLKAERIQAKAGAGGVCTLELGELPPGGSGSVVFAVRVDLPFPAGLEELVNEVAVSDDGGNGADRDPGDNAATDTTPVERAADVAVEKSDGGVTVRPGEVVVYTLDYFNLGDGEALGVVLEESLPPYGAFLPGSSSPGWSCTPVVVAAGGVGEKLKAERIQQKLKAERIQAKAGGGGVCALELGDLAPGASGSVELAVEVVSPLPSGVDELVNRVRISSESEDLEPGNDQSTVVTPVAAAPDLGVSKTDGGVAVAPGGAVVYSLAFENQGDQGASGVVLVETVPLHGEYREEGSTPGWVCSPGGLAAGVGEKLKAERIQQKLEALRAAGEAGGGTPCVLEVGDLPAGASGEATFAVAVDPGVPAEVGLLENVVRVSDDGENGEDPDPLDDVAVETTPVERREEPPEPEVAVLDLFLTDLLAEDRDDSGSPSAGDVLTYSVEVRSTGEAAAEGVLFRVPVPEHVRYVAGSAFSDRLVEAGLAGGVLTVLLEDLPPGAVGALVWDVEIDPELPEGVRAIVAQGSVEAAGVEPHPSDDPATAERDDPTVTPLDAGGGGSGEVESIPTVSEWGLLLLGLLLVVGAWRVLG